MLDWLNSFMASLDKETVLVLSTGAGTMIGATYLTILGARKGKPSQSSLEETAAAITSMSCGAPELTPLINEILEYLKTVRDENRVAVARQDEIVRDLDAIKTATTILQDRTRGLGS